MTNAKLNVYKIVLQEICEKFNGIEEFIKKRIEERKIIRRRGNLFVY